MDLDDLPLNISRETLHQNKILRVLTKNLANVYLEMCAEISRKNDEYKYFYEQFGKRLELGIHEVIQLVSQDRISDCTVEQIVGPKRVSELIEEQVDIPVPEVAEQIVAMPVPWIREETGELIQLIPQGQISDRVSEQNIDVAVPEIGNRTSKRLWSTFHKSQCRITQRSESLKCQFRRLGRKLGK